MSTSIFDHYFNLFGAPAQAPILPALNMPPIPAAPVVAPTAQQPQAPVAAQPNNDALRLITQAFGRRDPLGETARRNSTSNQTHTMDEWRAMFAPVHPQQAYTPDQRMAALDQLRNQSGAEHLNIGGGHIVTPPEQSQVGTGVMTFDNPDGSRDISYPNKMGVPQAPGFITGSVHYPNPNPTIPQPIPGMPPRPEDAIMSWVNQLMGSL